jgi:hypothetical protein
MTNDLNTLAAGWTFDSWSAIVVTGSNPENADYDNPRGEHFGEEAIVRAYNAHGDVREIALGVDECGSTKHRDAAERMATALNVRAAAGKLPVGFDKWEAGRPVYGSAAYLEYGMADDLEWERMNDQ